MTAKNPSIEALLAWFHLHPGASARDAAKHFFPDLEGPALANKAGGIRMAKSRARSAAGVPVPGREEPALEPAPRAALDASRRPSPTGASFTLPAELSQEQEVAAQLAAVNRAIGSMNGPIRKDLPALLKSARELRAELNQLRRSPPPVPGGADAPAPLFSDQQLADMEDDRLGRVISSLLIARGVKLTEKSVEAAFARADDESVDDEDPVG